MIDFIGCLTAFVLSLLLSKVESISIREAEILNKAISDGHLREFTDTRCPYDLSESNADFVATDENGSLINVDTKAIDGRGKRPLTRQTEDLTNNIQRLLGRLDKNGVPLKDPEPYHIVCDISAAPPFLHDNIYKQITKELSPNQINNITFLFD